MTSKQKPPRAPKVTRTADSTDIVRITNLKKKFVLRKDNSLKERLVTFGFSGRRHSEEFWALNGVTATLQAGTTVALIGHNGSGKSTLLKLIGGIIDPTSGTVERRGRIAALLELGAGFHPDLTGRENVYLNAAILGLNRAETAVRFDLIVEFSGIGDFIDTQVKFYSSGMYVRLAFAVAIHTDPDILLVDEVLAVGDEAFQRKCLDKIRTFQAEGRTIVLVTHSLDQVLELCDRAILLNDGVIQFDGDPWRAVAVFRDILEDRRVEAETNSTTEKVKSIEAEIHGVKCWAAGRSDSARIHLGDNIEVELDITFFQPRSDWIIAIMVDNTKGQAVYATTSFRLGEKISTAPGHRIARFTLHDTHFGTGKYWIHASILEPPGRHVVDLPQSCTFNAIGSELSVGTIHAETEYSEQLLDITGTSS